MSELLDTAPAVAPDEAFHDPAGSSRAAVTPRDAWRKARLPVALGIAFIVIAMLQAIQTGGTPVGRMDPESASPQGGLAIATLLRNRGIDVRRVEEPSGASGVTVFIPEPVRVAAYRPGGFDLARTAGDLVLAEAPDQALERMNVDAGVASVIDERELDPGCGHPDATAAGKVLLGGYTYGAGESAVPCYVHRGEASFIALDSPARRITLLGSGALFTNAHLDEEGNAALALRLLSRQPVVEWVYPRDIVVGEEPKSLVDLLPRRVLIVTAQAFVVVLLLALWRARRLGPVVVEPLPVVVRAAETVEGRARLYESAGARGQAGLALRAGLRDRLVRALGLAADAGPETLVAAVTARTGREPVALTSLLYGPPPADDAALVRLAEDLDQLDTEVRSL